MEPVNPMYGGDAITIPKPAPRGPERPAPPPSGGGRAIQNDMYDVQRRAVPVVTKPTGRAASASASADDTVELFGRTFNRRHLIIGGVAAFVLILIIALAAGLSGGDPEPEPVLPPQQAYASKLQECDALVAANATNAAIAACTAQLDALRPAYEAALAAAAAAAAGPTEPRNTLKLVLAPASARRLRRLHTRQLGDVHPRQAWVNAREARQLNAAAVANLTALVGGDEAAIQQALTDLVVTNTALESAELDQILLSAQDVAGAVEATIVLADFVSQTESELAALDLSNLVNNGTLSDVVSTDSAAFQLLQVLEEEYNLPINASRVQELAALAVESEAIQNLGAAVAEVYSFDTYGFLAGEVFPHLEFALPESFNTSIGAAGLQVEATMVRGNNVTVVNAAAVATLNASCGPVESLCDVVRAAVGTGATADMTLRLQAGRGRAVSLESAIELSNFRLSRYQIDGEPLCPASSSAASVMLASAEVFADVSAELGSGGLTMVSSMAMDIGVRVVIDVELGKREAGDCGGPAIRQPLRLFGGLRIVRGDAGQTLSAVTVLSGDVYMLGVLYQPFDIPSLALSDVKFEVDIVPSVLTVSRLEGTALLSIGQECYLRKEPTHTVIAIKNVSDPNSGCIEGSAVFGVGLGLGASESDGAYFIATIPSGPNIGKLVNAFAPERVTSVVDGFPAIITGSGFVGVLEMTFASSEMTLGQQVGGGRVLPRGLVATGTFDFLSFQSQARMLVDPGLQLKIESNFSMGPNWGDYLRFEGGDLLVDIRGPGGFALPNSVVVRLQGSLRILFSTVNAVMTINDTSARASVELVNLFGVDGLGASVVATAVTPRTSWSLDGVGEALMAADFTLRGELTIPPLPIADWLSTLRDLASPLLDVADWVETKLREMWAAGENAIDVAENGIRSLGFNIPTNGDAAEVDAVDRETRSLKDRFNAAVDSLAATLNGIEVSASFEVGTGGSVGSYLEVIFTAVLANGTTKSFSGRLAHSMSLQSMLAVVYNAIVAEYVPTLAELQAAMTRVVGKFNEMRTRIENADTYGYVYTRDCELIPDTRSMPCTDDVLGICHRWQGCPAGFGSATPFVYIGHCVESPYDPCPDAHAGYVCAVQLCFLEL